MAADGLGGVLGLGNLIHQNDLKGVLKDAGHVVPVELLLSAGAVDGSQVLADPRVAADIDLEAALHPQDGLDNPLDVVVVGLSHLGGAVDKGMAGGHLAVRPLHGNSYGLLCPGQEGAVKTHQGNKLRVQNGGVLQLHVDAKSVHGDSPLSSRLKCWETIAV